MSKSTWLKILGGIVLVGGAVASAATGGLAPALIAGGSALVTYLAGLNQPSPAAKTAFGIEAK